MSRFSLVLLLLWLPATAIAQETVEEAARGVRIAWLEHNAMALLSSPDPVVVGLPGVDQTRPLPPRQAAALLNDFWALGEERGFVLGDIRKISEVEGYASATREYVVSGTAELLRNRILVGFRRVRGRWRVSEILIQEASAGDR